MTSGDFNNDGKPDLVFLFSQTKTNLAYVFRNDGAGKFTRVSTTDFGFCAPGTPVASDLNADTNADLTVSVFDFRCGGASAALGKGNGAFAKPGPAPHGDQTLGYLVRDLSLDSRHDIVYNVLSGFVTVGLATSGAKNCTPPSSANLAAKICTPASAAHVSSPVTVRASGNSPVGVKRLEVWIDGKKQYAKLNDQLAKSFALTAGSHRIAVVAVDQFKGTSTKTVNVTVP